VLFPLPQEGEILTFRQALIPELQEGFLQQIRQLLLIRDDLIPLTLIHRQRLIQQKEEWLRVKEKTLTVM
jgi:hypothetical protein